MPAPAVRRRATPNFSSSSTIKRVGSASATATNAASVTISYTATTGNLLVVVMAAVIGAAPTVSDGVNTWTLFGTGYWDGQAYYAKNITGGALNIICSGGTKDWSAQVIEISGASTSSPIHYEANASNSGGTMSSGATSAGASTDFAVGLAFLATGAALAETLKSPQFTPTLGLQRNETPVSVVGASTSSNVLISSGPVNTAATQTFGVISSTSGATLAASYCVLIH